MDRARKVDRQSAASELSHTSIPEWLTGIVGGLCLAALIGYLLVIAWSRPVGPPRFEISLAATSTLQDRHIVEFIAANRGGKSARAVTITGQLLANDEVVEEASVTLDYLAWNSRGNAALIFTHDPDAFELRLFASGYAEP